MFFSRFDSPLCEIVVAGNGEGLSNLHLDTGEGSRVFEVDPLWIRDDNFFKDVRTQIDEFFAGKRRNFEVKLNPHGTDFQHMVWDELVKVPFGELRSYKDIAVALGRDKASRAIGMANSKNPIPLIVPCHRIVGANGALTGFAHGLDIKEKLINFEREVLGKG